MAREILKVPDWWHWPRDWIGEIKSRKGWTDKDLAEYLGVTDRTLRDIKKHPYNHSGKHILRILYLREQTKWRNQGMTKRALNKLEELINSTQTGDLVDRSVALGSAAMMALFLKECGDMDTDSYERTSRLLKSIESGLRGEEAA